MIAGAADSVDLTPQSMVPLAGFANRRGVAARVADRIEANAIALRDADGRTAVIVTFDALYVGPVVDAALRGLLTGECGVRDEDILLLASHTHFTPSLDPGKPRLGAVDGAYLASAIARCRAMLRRLLAKPFEPLTLSRAETSWDGAIHRRKRWPLPYFGGDNGRFGWHEPAMAPNDAGPRDPRVRTWQLRTEDGAPLAILWSCACHPTGFPYQNEVSAEFPGHVRAALRAGHGETLPILFLQGFAGDIRQRAPETRPALRNLARTLRYGPSFCAFDAAGWTRWTEALADTVVSTLKADPVPLFGPIRSAATRTGLAALLDGDNGDRDVEFRRLSIGDQLDFWAVAAEPSVALKACIPDAPTTIALGYLGDVFGYWPTELQAAEGGYEGRGFIEIFGLKGRFRPLIDTIFKDMVERLRADRQ